MRRLCPLKSETPDVTALLPAEMHPAPLAPHFDFAEAGPGVPALLAALPGLSKAALAALPPEWVALPGLLVTLIEDEGLTKEMAAHEAAVPVGLVSAYRALMDT